MSDSVRDQLAAIIAPVLKRNLGGADMPQLAERVAGAVLESGLLRPVVPVGMTAEKLRTARTGHELIAAADTLASSQPSYPSPERQAAWEVINDVAAALEVAGIPPNPAHEETP